MTANKTEWIWRNEERIKDIETWRVPYEDGKPLPRLGGGQTTIDATYSITGLLTHDTDYTAVRNLPPLKQRTPLDQGASLDRYRIDRLIGKGGFALVYRANHQLLRRPLALKEMFYGQLYERDNAGFLVSRPVEDGRAFAEYDRSLRSAFMQEADILSNLRHPNIVAAHDFFQYNNTIYLTLEWIEGVQLSQALPLSRNENGIGIHRLFDQLCSGLIHVHSAGYAHCDVNPSNIILQNGECDLPVLIDFGAATPFDDASAVQAYLMNDGFSPPEQYEKGPRTVKMDVYALGATMFTAITGMKSPRALDLPASFSVGDALVNHRYDVGGPLIEAIGAAMAPDPKDRFDSVNAFRDAVYPKPAPRRGLTEPKSQGERVFISYRREDGAHFIGRLYDLLKWRCGIDSVFLDVVDIPVGATFTDEVEHAICSCAAMIVAIGPGWLRPQTSENKTPDFVMMEIEAALRANLPIVPVLFDGAAMPTVEQLPTEVHGITKINGILIPDAAAFASAGDLVVAMIETHRSSWRMSNSEHKVKPNLANGQSTDFKSN